MAKPQEDVSLALTAITETPRSSKRCKATWSSSPTRTGHDVFLEAVVANETRRLLKDGHGSTRALVDATGAVIQSGTTAQVFAYDAYGVPIGFTLTDALTTHLYSGEQTDQLTGLQYLRARYYNPATGGFNRLDPFAGNFSEPQSLHKYLYTHGDPVNGWDPSGLLTMATTLSAIKISSAIGAVTGAVCGGIRNGWQGAFEGALVGAFTAPIATVAVLWGGWALSVFLPISEATGMFLVGSLAAEISAKHALYAWSHAETEQEKRAAAFALTITGIGWAVGATAYMRSQYVSHQQMRQQGMYSEIPEMYINKNNNIDMSSAPGIAVNAAGHPRNCLWYFKQLYQKSPRMFSPDNLNRIYGWGRYYRRPEVPVIDEVWVQNGNATHRSWMGAKLTHHHIGQGAVATAIPKPVHVAWTAVLHPNVNANAPATGGSGG